MLHFWWLLPSFPNAWSTVRALRSGYTYPHMCTCMHTHVWVCTWTHVGTHNLSTHTHGQRPPCPHMHSGAHTYLPPTHMHIHTPIHMHVHTCTQAHMHTYTRTHNTHTHTPYKHTHTCSPSHLNIWGSEGSQGTVDMEGGLSFTHHLCPQRQLPRQSILHPQPSHILGTPAPMVLHSTLQVLPKPAYPEASAAPSTPVFKWPGCPAAHSK